jgi:TonB family protein
MPVMTLQRSVLAVGLCTAWILGAQTKRENPPQMKLVRAIPISRVEPRYAPEALAAGLRGSVILYVEVSPEGQMMTARVIQSLGLGLDEKAVEAVRQWSFSPGTAYGVPVKTEQSVEVTFLLHPAAPWRIRRALYQAKRPQSTRGMSDPRLIQYVSPDPGACGADEGAAAISLKISKDGEPQEAKLLDQQGSSVSSAALKAISSWKFEPAAKAGKPSEGRGTVEMECQPAPNSAGNDAPPKTYKTDGEVSAPLLAYKVEPDYSEAARQEKFSGRVVLTIVVDASGHVVEALVALPLGLGLDEQAMRAVMQWRFKPALKDGKPVAVQANVEVNFRIL